MVAEREVSGGAIISVLGYCGALVSISQVSAFPLLSILPDELDTSIGNVSWVATAAFLTGAVANPVVGRLGDMYGKRRMMIISLWILTFGCLMAALTTNILILIIGRALQGLGIAVVPLGMAIAKETLPASQTSKGVALVSATLGIGGGVGLPLAGILVGWFNWQAVFWATGSLSLIGVTAAWALLPADTGQSRERFDVVGGIWLSACLVAILLPLSKSATWGWAQPLPLALYAIGFFGLVGWYRYEQTPERPLVDIRLMRQRPLLIVNTAGLLMGYAMVTNVFGALILLQTTDKVSHGFGASVVLAGLVTLPGGIAMMLTSPISAWMIDRWDARTALWIGATLMGLGYAVRPVMLGSLFAIGLGVAIVNAAIGIAYSAFPSAIMAHVPHSELGSANAIGTLTRASGSAVASASIAAILNAMTTEVDGQAIPRLAAFHVAFAIAGVLSFASALLAYQLPRTVRTEVDAGDEFVALPGVAGSSVVAKIRGRR
jgi:MFS family permease